MAYPPANHPPSIRRPVTRRHAALLALLALAANAASPAAAATCLDVPTLEAARINQFQTLAMTVSLRCRVVSGRVEERFSQLMMVHRGYFAAADRVMHGFVGARHGFSGAHAFDSYATLLANRYGGGATTPAACSAMERALDAATNDASGRTLHRIAVAMVAEPEAQRLGCPAAGAVYARR